MIAYVDKIPSNPIVKPHNKVLLFGREGNYL